MALKVGTTGVNALAWAKLRSRILTFFHPHRLEEMMRQRRTLDEATRSEMESLLGYDFRGVHIYETRCAREITRVLGAEAFTIGSNIFAAEGKLHTGTIEGKALLAHELIHVIQQTRPRPVVCRPAVSGADGGEIYGAPPNGKLNLSLQGNFFKVPPISAAQFAKTGLSSDPGNPMLRMVEVVAEEVEQEVRHQVGAATGAKGHASAVSTEEIADIVYEFMQKELLLERDRLRR